MNGDGRPLQCRHRSNRRLLGLAQASLSRVPECPPLRKVLIFGDSHLAALKLGWDTQPVRPDWSIQFFGAPSTSLTELRPRGDGAVFAGSDRLSYKMHALWGVSEVRPEDYDVVCVAGLSATALSFARSVATEHDMPLLPDELKAAARRLVSSSLAAQTVRTVRQVTGKPIVMIETPAPGLNDDGSFRAGIPSSVESDRDAQVFSDAFLWGLRTMDGVDDVLRQPAETKANALFTKPEYSRGSVRLSVKSVEHGDQDRKHMNGAYGIKVLQALDRVVRH